MKPDMEAILQKRWKKKQDKLPAFVKDYFWELTYQGKSIRTQMEYAKDLRLFFEYCLARFHQDSEELLRLTPSWLVKLTSQDIYEFLLYLRTYSRTVQTKNGQYRERTFSNEEIGQERKLAVLRDFFSFALRQNWVHDNISERIAFPNRPKNTLRHRLTTEELQQVLTAIRHPSKVSGHQQQFHQKLQLRDETIVLLLAYTGIRVSELVQLDREDMWLKEKRMQVIRKGGAKEWLYLPEVLMDPLRLYEHALHQWKSVSPAFFLSLQGRRIDPKTIQARLTYYQTQAQLTTHLTPHVFRRTFGTSHYNRYHDMYLTAQVMGHRSAETTRRFYADPTEERKKQSMESFDYE
jgi:integrase/recombinase XerC